MTLTTSKRLARWIGCLVGLGAAVWIVILGRVEARHVVPAARLTLVAKPTEVLMTEPAGTKFLSADLRPGRPTRGMRGSVEVTNVTLKPVAVTVKARLSSEDLDRVVSIELSAGGETVFRGSLGGLRAGWHGFHLPARQRRRLAARAWVPASVTKGYRGRSVDVTLEWKTRELSA